MAIVSDDDKDCDDDVSKKAAPAGATVVSMSARMRFCQVSACRVRHFSNPEKLVTKEGINMWIFEERYVLGQGGSDQLSNTLL